ncbi:MAG: T9SS type A sorting domain-containing protein [Bacteroidetes bacterium]|nr:T9SS type A sorting domain-containing protein [Bacteroidota bacterium]
MSFAVVYTVTNTNDAGPGSLRDAVTMANASSGADVIQFQIPGSSWNINILTPLPPLNDSISIDGNTQPGSSFPLNLVTIDAYSLNISHGIMLHSNNISISGLKFRSFNVGAGIFSDYLGFGNSTNNNLLISGNVFQDSKYGISIKHYGFRNVIISSNKFWNCTDININYTPRYYSKDVSIFNNEFIGHNTSSFSVAVVLCEFSFPYGKVTNISILGNSIRNCVSGIVVRGFTKIDTLSIIGNTIDAMRGGVGINFGDGSGNNDSCKHVLVEGNVLDSCGGISFWCLASSDTLVYKDITIRNNSLYGTLAFALTGTSPLSTELFSNVLVENNNIPYGIYIEAGGTGLVYATIDSLSIIGNTMTEVNNNGIRFFCHGTGSFWSSVTNVLLRRNTISNSFDNGIGISYSAISSAKTNISNFVIDSNVISQCPGNGISINAYGNNGGNRLIDDVFIGDNEIFSNTEHGINLETSSTNPFQGVHIVRNSISGNGLTGIFESPTSIYANPKLPEPIPDWVNAQTGTLAGHVITQPFTAYDIQFYANNVPGNNGKGEGKYYFSTQPVFTDATGYASFQVSIPVNLSNLYYSSTATDVALSSTSEFSNAIDSSVVQTVKEEMMAGIRVFPLPADDNLFMSREITIDIGKVSLIDLTGRVLFQRKYEASANLLMIDVSSVPDGCYILQYETEKGIFSDKAMVQH